MTKAAWIVVALVGSVAGMSVASTGCALKAEEQKPDTGGSTSGSSGSTSGGSSSGGSSSGGSSSGGSSSGGSTAGGGTDAGTQPTDGAFKIGDSFKVEVNSKQPEVDIPTYGKERGHRFVIDLPSDKETTITLCPDKTTDTPSNLYMHPEGDEKAIVYGAQRPGYQYQGNSLGKFRPMQSGRFVIYASNAVGGLRDTGGVYILSAAVSTNDNDSCPR